MKLQADNRRVRYLLDEEERRLLPHLGGPLEHVRAAVIVAVGIGMRRGDQLNLRWERVDLQRDVIWVPNAMSGQSCYGVPMSARVREVMLGLKRRAGASEYVFVNPRTGRPYRELRRPFETACRRARS